MQVTQGYITDIGSRETNGKFGPGFQFFVTLDNNIKVSLNGKKPSPCGKDAGGNWKSFGVGDYLQCVYTVNGEYNNTKSSDIVVTPQGAAPYVHNGGQAAQQAAPTPQGAPQARGPAQAQRPAGGKVHGATVGMAINNAVAAFIGGKIDESDIPSFSSRLLKLATALEGGKVFEQKGGNVGSPDTPSQAPAPAQQAPAPQTPPPAPAPAPAPPAAQPPVNNFEDDGFDDDIPF